MFLLHENFIQKFYNLQSTNSTNEIINPFQTGVSDEEYPGVLANYCNAVKDEGLIDLDNETEHFWFVIISLFSIAGSLIVYASVAFIPKLQSHPYKLISSIALLDAFYYIVFISVEEICDWKLYEVFSATVYWSEEPIFKLRSIWILSLSGVYLFRAAFMMSFLLNTFLCVDLYQTVVNPFASADKRVKKYVIFSILIAAFCIVAEATFLAQGDQLYYEQNTIFYCYCFFFTIAVVTTLLASGRMLKPGVSKQVRHQVLGRHVKYIIVIAISFSLYAIKILLRDLQGKSDYPNWLSLTANLLCASQGILLTLLRLSEPLVIKTLSQKTKVLCCGAKPVEDDDDEETLNVFLATSFNVELVYVILKSVTKFAKVQQKKDSQENGGDISQSFEGSEKKQNNDIQIEEKGTSTIMTIRSIKIKNPKAWEVTKTEDFISKDGIDVGSAEASENKLLETDVIDLQTKAKVEAHAPHLFNKVRQQNGVSHQTILDSLSPKHNRDMVFKAGEGAGASGSFFFFSHDRKFIIKTMSGGELKLMIQLLSDYNDHLAEIPDSLIARIYGIYSIKLQDIKKVNLIIMANTLKFRQPDLIERIFDIKGSKVAREVEWTSQTKGTTTLKDINFLKLQQMSGGRMSNFHETEVKNLLKVCELDTKFFKDRNLMDYSLLLAVERITAKTFASKSNAKKADAGSDEKQNLMAINEDEENAPQNDGDDIYRQLVNRCLYQGGFEGRQQVNEFLQDLGVNDERVLLSRHQFMSKDARYLYHISIIDYLQEWNTNKKGEAFAKTWFLRKNAQQLSAVPAVNYQPRFNKFCKESVFVSREAPARRSTLVRPQL